MTQNRLSVLIDEDLKAQCKARAALEHTTLSDVIREFLTQYAAGGPLELKDKPTKSTPQK